MGSNMVGMEPASVNGITIVGFGDSITAAACRMPDESKLKHPRAICRMLKRLVAGMPGWNVTGK